MNTTITINHEGGIVALKGVFKVKDKKKYFEELKNFIEDKTR